MRTQGEWRCTLNYIGVPLIRITHFNGSECLQIDEANAAYTALAVNNLHLLADFIEWCVDEIEQTPDELSDALLGMIKIKAKITLGLIS